MAGRVIVPATRVIRTSFEERISVSSEITLLFDLPNSSKIINPLWFCGMMPALVWYEPPAVLFEPPTRPGIVAEFPARDVNTPSSYVSLRASAVEDLPTLDSPTIKTSRYPLTFLKFPKWNSNAV